MIEKTLFDKLNETGYSVYPLKLPQKVTYPALIYTLISGNNTQEIRGDIIGKKTRFQIDIFATTYKQAKQIKDEVIAKILELKATNINEVDNFEEDIDVYRLILDFYLIT